MDDRQARPIMDEELNEHHLKWAIETIKFVAKCYKQYDGDIISDLRIYGMQKYSDYQFQADHVIPALEGLLDVVKLGGVSDLKELVNHLTQKEAARETDQEIINRIFPLGQA